MRFHPLRWPKPGTWHGRVLELWSSQRMLVLMERCIACQGLLGLWKPRGDSLSTPLLQKDVSNSKLGIM